MDFPLSTVLFIPWQHKIKLFKCPLVTPTSTQLSSIITRLGYCDPSSFRSRIRRWPTETHFHNYRSRHTMKYNPAGGNYWTKFNANSSSLCSLHTAQVASRGAFSCISGPFKMIWLLQIECWREQVKKGLVGGGTFVGCSLTLSNCAGGSPNRGLLGTYPVSESITISFSFPHVIMYMFCLLLLLCRLLLSTSGAADRLHFSKVLIF